MRKQNKGAKNRLAGSIKDWSFYIFIAAGRPFEISPVHRQNTQKYMSTCTSRQKYYY